MEIKGCTTMPVFALRVLCSGVDCSAGAERLYGPDGRYACHCARAIAEATPACRALRKFGFRPGVYVVRSGRAVWAFVVAPGPDGRMAVDVHYAEENADLLVKFARALAEEPGLRVVDVKD